MWLEVEVKCQFYFYFIEVFRNGGGFDRDLDDGVGDGNVLPAGFVHNPQQEVRRVEKARGPNIKSGLQAGWKVLNISRFLGEEASKDLDQAGLLG